MRVRVFFTVALIAAVVSSVSSQTGTADGVAAMARGDYQRAVEILKPIAEDWRSKDTVAQFFMAGLYESGHGVLADPPIVHSDGKRFPYFARSLQAVAWSLTTNVSGSPTSASTVRLNL